MPNRRLLFTPRGRGGWALHGTGGVRSRYLPFSEHSLSNVQTFQDSSIYPLFFHILAHSFAHFRTHAKLNPFVFKQFRTLCAIHEGDGDGPDGRPGRDLLDEVLHGSPKAQAAVSRQPRQLPQSDRRDGNPALFDGRTDSRGGLFREFRGVAGEPNQDVGIQEDHFFMTFHCFSGTTWSISPVILNSPAMKPKRLFCGARRERPLRPACRAW